MCDVFNGSFSRGAAGSHYCGFDVLFTHHNANDETSLVINIISEK